MARQALKHLVEKRLDEEMAQYIGSRKTSSPVPGRPKEKRCDEYVT